MPFKKTLFAAMAALALTAGCRKQEELVTTVPFSPPAAVTAGQPSEPTPSPQGSNATTGSGDVGRAIGQTSDNTALSTMNDLPESPILSTKDLLDAPSKGWAETERGEKAR